MSSHDIQKLAAAHDHSDMARVIERSPEQISFALTDPAFPAIPHGSYDQVVVVGMGGSALPADVLEGAFSDTIRPLRICRDYRVIGGVNQNTLAICCSFSGNTEETLEAAGALADQRVPLVVLTGGGKLAALAEARDYPLIRVPTDRDGPGFQPRSATGYMATYLARCLAAIGWFDTLDDLAKVPDTLKRLDLRTEAEEVARWLGDRVPIVYTERRHLNSVARVLKIKLNEHAKRPAFFNEIPEINHNEMIGFTQPTARFAILYVRDPHGHSRAHRRFDVMRSVFRTKGLDHVDFREWTLPSESLAVRTFAGVIFGDWCAYTAALLAELDPTPVALVEEFKRELA